MVRRVELSWGESLRLGEIPAGGLQVALAPDAAARAQIAKRLGLESLPALTAELELRPWLDGAQVHGRLDARVEQVCGVSLEPFEQAVTGEIEVRVVPPGSPHAPVESAEEMELDPDLPDPPDVLAGEGLDLADYVFEHLALEIDPFPRKPGAAFAYEPPTEDDSPFAALKALKDRER